MRVMISYRVREDRLEDHRRLLAEVFAELERLRPAGLRYESTVSEDGLSFVDLVEGPELPAPLPALPAFQRYRAGLDDRCASPVVRTGLTPLHRYDPAATAAASVAHGAAEGIWFTPQELEYLSSQLLGRLATVDGGHAPQNNPVGFVLDHQRRQLVIGGLAMGASRKFRNVGHNPQVAFVIDDLASLEPWTPRGVEIRGVAEPAVDQEPPMEGFSSETIRITPSWIGAWGIEPGTSFDLQSRRAPDRTPATKPAHQ